MKEFIFSKFADLQSLIDYRPTVFYMCFSRALTAEEAQLLCRNTSAWLLPLQKETQNENEQQYSTYLKNG